MSSSSYLPANAVRTLFSSAMSRMYQAEVPKYGTLVSLVSRVNSQVRRDEPELNRCLVANGEIERLNLERHGAIRLGKPEELAIIRRVFAVMGMQAVGYYDLSVAGVPVHSTAFRPTKEADLLANPFRVFTSLLRLDLIEDSALREEAGAILGRRMVFTPVCLELLEAAEAQGGLTGSQVFSFIDELLETFRWHGEATVSIDTYERLRNAHPLIADVVCFRVPHINHLTPRTLDIDAAQKEMIASGLDAKSFIEGPPTRRVPILLRQTSFKALNEAVAFPTENGPTQMSYHTARFGEIEQRGVALTPKGRALYDQLLAESRADAARSCGCAGVYEAALQKRFTAFPDDVTELRQQGLAYFRYRAMGLTQAGANDDLEAQIKRGSIRADLITYEDFLPVSAAGIFRSNLGDDSRDAFAANFNQVAFEQALGAPVLNPFDLYADIERQSLLEIDRGVGNAARAGQVLDNA